MLRFALIVVFALAAPACGAADALRVAVSANFRPTLVELATAYRDASGIELRISGGATGQLYAQIVNGAPFDVFLAADQASVGKLVDSGLGVADTRITYATGRLALLAPGRAVPADGEIPDLADVDTIVIANPRTAPYGAAALEVLDQLDIAGIRLALAQSVGGVASAVTSGAAPVGLTALSLVPAAERGRVWEIPDDLHGPLRQDGVVLAGAGDIQAGAAFLTWLGTAPARKIMRAHGYDVD